jgi:hypothetical protein
VGTLHREEERGERSTIVSSNECDVCADRSLFFLLTD